MATVLERLAEEISNGTAAPPAQSRLLGIHLLDTLGAWIAGSKTPEAARLTGLGVDALFGAGPLDAVALRVATIRLTEIDDIHMLSCTTPSSIVVPTALSLAAASGKPRSLVFAQALNAGYEAITRLGSAVAGPSILYRGIWPTYLVAPFGAAAVTARMLALDAGKTADALAIALSMTCGRPGGHTTGASSRWLLVGQAARVGSLAGFAAARGYAGDRTLLDGDWLNRVHGINCDISTLLTPAEAGGAIATLSLKPYCAAKQTIATIDAFCELLEGGVLPAEIMAIRVSVPPAYSAMISGRQVTASRTQRIVSAAYNLALAAYRRDDLIDVMRPDHSADERISALMARVAIVEDQELLRFYPQRWPARVTANLTDGREVSALVIDARGDPARSLDSVAVTKKFHLLVAPLLDRRNADEIVAACLSATENDSALAKLCTAF